MKHPLPAAVLLPILATLWETIGSVISGVFSLNSYLCVIAVTLLLLPIHKFACRPLYRGSFRKEGLADWKAWLCIFIFLAADLILLAIGGVLNGFHLPELSFLPPSLMAGICEEIIFRALPLSVMMYSYKQRSAVFPLALTSAFFGICHLSNLFAGAATGITLLQVVTASFTGLFMGALYLKTGNLLLSVFLHTAHDFISFWQIGGAEALTFEVTPLVLAQEGCLLLIELLCIIFLMKDQKNSILPVWEERWSGPKEN